jgi:hypothetical protein
MHQRKSLLNSKYKAAHIDIECSINLLFRYGAKRSHLIPYACIGKDNVNAPLILCNLRVEPVKVFQVGNIPLDGRDILSNFRFLEIFAVAAVPCARPLARAFAHLIQGSE